MFDHDLNFETAKDLIDFLLGDNVLSPKSLFDVSERLTSGYLFRGQSNINWSLTPSAHRPSKPLENYTPQPQTTYQQRNLTGENIWHYIFMPN